MSASGKQSGARTKRQFAAATGKQAAGVMQSGLPLMQFTRSQQAALCKFKRNRQVYGATARSNRAKILWIWNCNVIKANFSWQELIDDGDLESRDAVRVVFSS